MTGPFAVGIDLGGTNIKAALVSRSTGLVVDRSSETEAHFGPERILDNIARLVDDLARQSPEPVSGIGIGSPGTIDLGRTTVLAPPNFPGWEKIHMGDALAARIGPLADRVIVENDANAAALGSAHYGAGSAFDSFIMITLGTGVGGAIIYQRRIFRGATGGAGEIGHMTIDYEGPVARSGVAGAIEAYIGQRFLSRHARYRLMNRHESSIHRMANYDLHGITPKMLHDAAVEGDEGAIEILAWAGHKLGVVLGSAVNLLDIRKIIVGGGLSAAGDFILGSARKSIVRYVTPGLQEGIEILRETRGNEVGMLGAAHLVFEWLDDQKGRATS